MLKYKRISLKLSGEAMGGAQAVDFDKAEAIARPAIWTATGRIKWVCWRLS